MPWFTGWTSPWLAVGKHHDGSPWSAQMTVPGLQAADDPHFYYLDNTGTLFFGPCGPGGGPYGRREHGRFRRSAGRISGGGEGVKHIGENVFSDSRPLFATPAELKGRKRYNHLKGCTLCDGTGRQGTSARFSRF